METSTRTDEVRDLINEKYGFAPNLMGELADQSPAVAEAYMALNEALTEVSLSPAQQQAVILAISAYNDCAYCKAVHTKMGKKAGLDDRTIDIILAGKIPAEVPLMGLIAATREILDKQGSVDQVSLDRLERHGVTRGKVYEIIGFIGLKTMSNYVNHINHTEIDPQFQ